MAKEPLSADEHRELGAALHQAQTNAGRWVVDLSHRYPTASKVVQRAEKIDKALSELRSELDSQFALDHAEEFDTHTHVYYPGSSASRPV